MRQLNEKEKIFNRDSNHDFADRFRIYDDQLSKFEQLREELSQKDKLISDLQGVVNNGLHSSNLKKVDLPITPVSIIFYIFLLIYNSKL